MPKKKIVYVKWQDASHPGTGGWHTNEDLQDFIDADHTVEHVGWIVHESKAELILASMVSFENERYGHIERIPKGLILKRNILASRKGK